MSAPGYPSPQQPPYPMPQPGGYSLPPYPVPPSNNPAAPAPGFSVYPASPMQPGGYQPGPNAPPPQGYQPGPNAPPPQGYQPGPNAPPQGYQPGPNAPPQGYQPGPNAPPQGYQPDPTAPPQGYQPSPGHPMQPGYHHVPGGFQPGPAATPKDPNAVVTPFATVPAGVPPGLEYLTQIDQVLVHQKIELLEALIGFETNNQYEIKNSMGQMIFHAQEKNDCCTRNCCGSLRHFNIKITDNFGHEVIHLIRPFKCASCWCPCCLQELEVQSPPGTTIGFVIQNWHPFLPKFSIQNASKETVMKVVGPCMACNCCGDVNFEVKTPDENAAIGRISKQWSGLVKEMLTDTDNFGIQFPMDLDVKIKAVLLGACFLIDFMFFEKVGEANQRHTVLS
ncbi:phospholipid scramblase 3b isoform X2 [Erpetoichthys calabaricus]|uniref:phospholipid scramblase 3b isoform X2 n=1 Tax=Erpetoichthys calabaricus TaxID=27687 RepID=UPI002234CD46|nr:phospholipid scramblase 3b isoform X2 [Erpetoichthys calabaricus]